MPSFWPYARHAWSHARRHSTIGDWLKQRPLSTSNRRSMRRVATRRRPYRRRTYRRRYPYRRRPYRRRTYRRRPYRYYRRRNPRRRRFGMTNMGKPPINSLRNKAQVEKKLHSFPLTANNLFFIPTSINNNPFKLLHPLTKQVTGGTMSTAAACASNGYGRLDFVFLNTPPYILKSVPPNPSTAAEYNALPAFTLIYNHPFKFQVDQFPRMNVYSILPPAPDNVDEYLKNYKFVKFKNIKVTFYLVHPWTGATLGYSGATGSQNPGAYSSDSGSNSQKPLLHIYHEQSTIPIADYRNLSDVNLPKTMQCFWKFLNSDNDNFRTEIAYDNQGEPSETIPTVNDSYAAQLTVTGNYRPRRFNKRCSWRYNPRLSQLKMQYDSSPSFNVTYRGSIKTYGPENASVYKLPDNVKLDYYHGTITYLPMPVMYVPADWTKTVTGQQPGYISSIYNFEKAQYPDRIQHNMGVPAWSQLSCYDQDAKTLELNPMASKVARGEQQDPIVNMFVSFQIVFWGRRSNSSSSSSSITLNCASTLNSATQILSVEPSNAVDDTAVETAKITLADDVDFASVPPSPVVDAEDG